MSEPTEFELLDVATPYALDAVSDPERSDIDRQVAAAPRPVAEAFGEEVRAVRETMAVVSAATAADPSPHLRAAVLSAVESGPVRRRHWRTIAFAAAAAVVVGAAGFGIGLALRPSPTLGERVLAAPDVRSVSGPLLSGGSATVVFSRDKNAAVLVMNNVPPPPPGSVYEMWLLASQGPTSAGTMKTSTATPSTTAVISDLKGSTAVAFTVEPGKGSPRPTGRMLSQLPLT